MWPSNNNNRVWIKWGMRMNTVLWSSDAVVGYLVEREINAAALVTRTKRFWRGRGRDEGTLLRGIIKHEWRDAAADDDVSFFIHPLICYQSTPPGSASLGWQGIKEAFVRVAEGVFIYHNNIGDSFPSSLGWCESGKSVWFNTRLIWICEFNSNPNIMILHVMYRRDVGDERDVTQL